MSYLKEQRRFDSEPRRSMCNLSGEDRRVTSANTHYVERWRYNEDGKEDISVLSTCKFNPRDEIATIKSEVRME